jgi:hypothetical protein
MIGQIRWENRVQSLPTAVGAKPPLELEQHFEKIENLSFATRFSGSKEKKF